MGVLFEGGPDNFFSSQKIASWFPIILFMYIYIFAIYLALRMQPLRIRRKKDNKIYFLPAVLLIDDIGIREKTDVSEKFIYWVGIVDIVKTRNHILFFFLVN